MMDESWQAYTGSKLPRRRSIDPKPARSAAPHSLDPSEFNDVFGGPPRSVFFRRYSGDFSSSFYDEIFRSATDSDRSSRSGRNLPVFHIPAAPHRSSEGFYDDIFGCGGADDRRSRSRSKSNSSSVLSSEDLSPLRPSKADDGGFSSFASKLRPINVPSRQSSSSTLSKEHMSSRRHGPSAAPCTRSSSMDYDHFFTDPNSTTNATTTTANDPKSQSFAFSHRLPSPHDTMISFEPSSCQSVKISIDDLDNIESPSSDISYVGHDLPDYHDQYDTTRVQVEDKSSWELEGDEGEEKLDGDRRDYNMCSYMIEMACDHQKRGQEIEEAVALDDAIAWARGKSQFPEAPQELKNERGAFDLEQECESEQRVKIDQGSQIIMELQAQPRRDFDKTRFLMATVSEECKTTGADIEEPQKSNMEKEQLEEEIKKWAAGKEGNICSLLSTLQYILWPNSGWHAIPLTSTIEASQVRKAYQKARLCLHPDKLQQKGSTTPQKYKAEKVFSILQDAWGAFNSREAFSG